MSNSSLATVHIPSPNRTSPRKHKIDTISIHCMAGDLSVESCGNLFANKDRGASSNYGIGSDGRIGLYVDEGDRSWCTSSGSNDHRAITIEVASEREHPYAVTQKAYDALINLLVDICQRNNIPQLLWKGDKSLIGQVDQQNMTVHRWFAAKACPGDYLYNLHGQIAEDVNNRLKEDNKVIYKTINDVPEWYRPSIQKLINYGVLQGNGNGEINVSEDFCRIFTVLDRRGII